MTTKIITGIPVHNVSKIALWLLLDGFGLAFFLYLKTTYKISNKTNKDVKDLVQKAKKEKNLIPVYIDIDNL